MPRTFPVLNFSFFHITYHIGDFVSLGSFKFHPYPSPEKIAELLAENWRPQTPYFHARGLGAKTPGGRAADYSGDGYG